MASAYLDSTGTAQCPMGGTTPPYRPRAGTDWSTNRLTVDCAGQFQLCFTLKAGNGYAPSSSDCTIVRTCTEAWYPVAGVTQELPPLEAWSGTDPACSTRFYETGGYGELSVLGRSAECEEIDDGAGGEYLFGIIPYCSPACGENPSLPECADCGMGTRGDF